MVSGKSTSCRRNTALRKQVEGQVPKINRGWITGRPRSRGWNHSYTKRYIDSIIAALCLIALSPILAIIAIAVKLTCHGPVFFLQERTGYMGRRFKMFKFRTMIQDADKMKHHFTHLNLHRGNTPDFKIHRDPRITPIGHFLRKYSLDELPQLINVVKGDMRLVGPRPTSFNINTYSEHHLGRLASPPGITGKWQISGRSNVDFDLRVKLDCEYHEEQGPIQDLKILIKTPLSIVRGEGAY